MASIPEATQKLKNHGAADRPVMNFLFSILIVNCPILFIHFVTIEVNKSFLESNNCTIFTMNNVQAKSSPL